MDFGWFSLSRGNAVDETNDGSGNVDTEEQL